MNIGQLGFKLFDEDNIIDGVFDRENCSHSDESEPIGPA
jgi:hypothetical protein